MTINADNQTLFPHKQAIGILSSTLRQNDYPQSYLGELIHFLSLEIGSGDKLTTKQVSLLQQVLFSLKKQIPVEYIVRETVFYNRRFYVTRDVLIPRFFTEELVEKCIKNVKEVAPEQACVIDIGTGSGALIITLALELSKFVNASFMAIDPSPAALAIATKNAQNYNVSKHISFLSEKDYPKAASGKPLVPSENVVFIIANPPYIAPKHFEKLPISVKEYEPALALREQPTFLSHLRYYGDYLLQQGKQVFMYLEYNNAQGIAEIYDFSPYSTRSLDDLLR